MLWILFEHGVFARGCLVPGTAARNGRFVYTLAILQNPRFLRREVDFDGDIVRVSESVTEKEGGKLCKKSEMRYPGSESNASMVGTGLQVDNAGFLNSWVCYRSTRHSVPVGGEFASRRLDLVPQPKGNARPQWRGNSPPALRWFRAIPRPASRRGDEKSGKEAPLPEDEGVLFPELALETAMIFNEIRIPEASSPKQLTFSRCVETLRRA